MTVLVIPCYNEAKRLQPQVFLDFLEDHPEFEFIFVDDGSTDHTKEVLRSIRGGQRTGILSLEKNVGKGEAVRRGVGMALERSPTLVGFWDADLATPLWEAPRLCEILLGSPDLDFVMGSRINRAGSLIRRGFWRHLVGRVFANLAARAIGTAVYDTQCGAKVFRAQVAEELFSRAFIGSWSFDVEILARQHHWRGRSENTREVPLRQWIDAAGGSFGLLDGLNAFLDLWKIYRRYSWKR